VGVLSGVWRRGVRSLGWHLAPGSLQP